MRILNKRDLPAGPQRIFLVAWGFERFGGLEHHVTELALAHAARAREVQVLLEAPVPADNQYVRRLRDHHIPVSGAGSIAALADRLGHLRTDALDSVAAAVLGAARRLREQVVRVRTEPLSDSDEHWLATRHQHPVTVDFFRRLAAAATDAPPDLVHVHGTRLRQPWAVAWASSRQIATIYTEHLTLDEWSEQPDAASVHTMRTMAGVVACVSERSQRALRAVLGDAVPLALVRHIVPGDAVPTPLQTAGPLRVLCVARLEPYKGIDVLLRALAAAKAQGVQIHTRIAGAGAERHALESLAKSLALTEVQFLGAVEPDQLVACVRAADVIVLASRSEALPVALVEAMARGRAVVSTRVGGIAELVAHERTGLLVDAESPAQLAAALTRLDADRPFLARLAAAAHDAWRDGGWTPAAAVRDADALYRLAAARVAHVAPAAAGS